MRVQPRGNLTVELIRQHRFGPDGHDRVPPTHTHSHPHPTHKRFEACHTIDTDALCRHADKVELSRQALACDPWAVDARRRDVAYAPASYDPQADTAPPPIESESETITPVTGSTALAGLGVALIVPGTLLDVVA